MVYFYIINYADENDQMAIMAMNTLVKDMEKDDIDTLKAEKIEEEI